MNLQAGELHAGGSGSSARFFLGLLSTYPEKFYLYGDKSMNNRDITRVTQPLEKIGAFLAHAFRLDIWY